MEQVLSEPDRDESAHTTGRKSGRSKQVEIITRGERRRSWTVEQKREKSFGRELTPLRWHAGTGSALASFIHGVANC
jgi:hypothetical protein